VKLNFDKLLVLHFNFLYYPAIWLVLALLTNSVSKGQNLKWIGYQGGIAHRTGDGARHMNMQARPVSEINRRATHILFKEMGVVDTIRFFNQFSMGQGDYTKEREKWLGEISLDEAISQIKSHRENA